MQGSVSELNKKFNVFLCRSTSYLHPIPHLHYTRWGNHPFGPTDDFFFLYVRSTNKEAEKCLCVPITSSKLQAEVMAFTFLLFLAFFAGEINTSTQSI